MVKQVVQGLVKLFSSYGLAAGIFVFLLILTYLGTLEQIEHGLFDTQKKYFESLFVIHYFFDTVPVILPGVYLLLILLSINILVGGIIRMRKGWSQIGVLIIHGGILLLLVGGFITFKFSDDGHLTLYEGQQSSEFQSYHEWEILLTRHNDDGTATQYIIPGDDFYRATKDNPVTFEHPAMPFALRIDTYIRNAAPMQKGPMFEVDVPVVDGMFLSQRPPEKKNERNVAGAYATLVREDGSANQQLLLWGLLRDPVSVGVGEAEWTVDLRRKRWELPFTIALDEFRRELHARTAMAKSFESDVTKIEGQAEQPITIRMNEPLRHKGYTLYQASWGPQDAAPDEPLFSTFAVVRNPADKFPLYACIVITFGMTVHFSLKLRRYIRAERRRMAA